MHLVIKYELLQLLAPVGLMCGGLGDPYAVTSKRCPYAVKRRKDERGP